MRPIFTHATRALALIASVLLATGCASATPPPLTAREVAVTAPVDPAKPCKREPPAAVAGSGGPSAETGVQASFDRQANKIVLSAGTDVGLPELSRVVANPAALRESSPGEWLLSADLEISGTGSLKITAPDVRWMKLAVSGPGRFASVRVLGGKLSISGSCVTSWVPERNSAATDYAAGRGFLLARDGAQMTIDRAELRFLGYGSGESYGLSWRLAGTSGGVTNSIISDLYFGVYSYQVSGLTVTDNEVYNNAVYGIDPHTGSRDLKIQRNVVHDNGKHGIILAEDCVDSLISDNVVYNNRAHGIVLYLRSNRNIVERNESFRNQDEGININESSDNVVRFNRVYENVENGIGVGQGSSANVIERNDIRSNKKDGVRLVTQSTRTSVQNNIIGENVRFGVYVNADPVFTVTGNSIFKNRTGLVLTGDSTVSVGVNELFGNTDGDIESN